jgi:hypothetical protein
MLSLVFDNKDFFGDIAAGIGLRLDNSQKDYVEELIIENFEDIWATRGAYINGRRWAGGVDLVDTGRLREDLTSGRRIAITERSITVWTIVPYASYVDQKYPFLDMSASTLERIGEVYLRNFNDIEE